MQYDDIICVIVYKQPNMVIEVGENLQPYIHFEFCFSCPKRLFFNFYCTNTNDNKYLDENNNI
jgi:hypothetical protein